MLGPDPFRPLFSLAVEEETDAGVLLGRTVRNALRIPIPDTPFGIDRILPLLRVSASRGALGFLSHSSVMFSSRNRLGSTEQRRGMHRNLSELFTAKRGKTMANSSSTIRFLHARQRHEHRRRANPWQTTTIPRPSIVRPDQLESSADGVPAIRSPQPDRLETSQDTSTGSMTAGDVFALLALLTTTIAALSATVYGAQHVLDAISGYSTLDVLRMFGGTS